MKTKPRISGNARKSLHVQATVFDAAPQYANERSKHAITKMMAEAVDPDDHINVIRHFSECVFAGVTPPPHILIAVAERFKTYIDGSGDLLLDEAFGKRNVQGAKRPLKQRLKDEERTQVHWYMWCLRKEAELSGRELKILGAAADAVEKYQLRVKADSLEKEYIGAGIEHVFDDAYQIIKEMGFAQ
jgi:hypothetical protein